MAVIFDPGWGEQLKNALSGIGTGIRDLVNPNFEAQKKLEQALADPTIAQQYANMVSTNPDLLKSPAIGGRNADFIKGLKPSQAYQNEQAVQGAVGERLKDPTTRQEAAASRLGSKTDAERTLETQRIDINNLQLNDLKQYNAFLEAHPEIKDDAMARKATGYTMDGLNEIRRQAKLVADGEAMDPVQGRMLVEKMANNKLDPQDYRQLEAFAAAHKEAYKLIVDSMDFDRRAALERQMLNLRLSNSDRQGSSDRIFASLDMNARSMAAQYDIPYGAAVKMLGYDKTYPDQFKAVTSNITDDQVNELKNKVKMVDDAKRNSMVNQQLSRIQSILNSKDKADGNSMPLLTATLQESLASLGAITGKDIQVKMEGSGLFGMGKGKFKFITHDANGKEVELKESDLLNPTYYTMQGPEIRSNESSSPTSTNELDQKPNESDAEYEARLKAMQKGG